MTPPQLPTDGPIGDDLAREIVAWVKTTGQSVLTIPEHSFYAALYQS